MSDNPTPFSEQQTLTVQQAIDLAVQHHNAGELSEAENIYRQILEADPDQPQALHLLGVIAHQRGEHERAVDLIEKALTLKPDYADAYSNLGNALRKLGRFKEAKENYAVSIEINPHSSESYNNLGNLYRELGEFEESTVYYKNALVINPNFAEALNNLGTALKDLGRLDAAIESFQKALTLKPNFADAKSNLGIVFYELGRLVEALQIFESLNSPEGYARVLECLFALGKYDIFYKKQSTSERHFKNNIRAAAISAFASQQLDLTDPNPFCPKPLEFIQVYKNLGGIDDSDGFLRELIGELKSINSVWEPLNKTTKNGLQSSPNLFTKPVGLFAELEKILKERIEDYRQKFASEDCVFIQCFPEKLSVIGWSVRLFKGGHQEAHIHPSGWLSGVLYLQLPNNCNKNEGSIKFGLWGYDYPVLDKNYPEKQYFPVKGDIILFPSSLFHRTIPISSNKERISIAFDLKTEDQEVKDQNGR